MDNIRRYERPERTSTHGHCLGIEIIRIDKGRFGDVALDGLCSVTQYQWPGAVYEGKGQMQVIIDKRATPDQREALAAILHGREIREASTHWWRFHAMSDTVHPPLFEMIERDVDIEARTARASAKASSCCGGSCWRRSRLRRRPASRRSWRHCQTRRSRCRLAGGHGPRDGRGAQGADRAAGCRFRATLR